VRVLSYYLGSNVSYNLKRLVAVGLILQERSHHDRRVVRDRLSPEGRAVRAQIGRIFARHPEELAAQRGGTALAELNTRLYDLEQFWTEQVASQAVRRVSHFSDLAQAHEAAGAGD
jgi:DNA-binding MarR family transcriptional regulator